MDPAVRPAALERLDTLVGVWSLEADFPGESPMPLEGAHSVFEWTLDRQFLVERSEVPTAEAPDSLSIVAFDPENETYTQHYFDSRGVVRLYAMSFHDGVWKLWRDSADFSPLNFSQRFTGTLSDDGDTIRGTWEIAHDGSTWEHDFNLTYRRIK